MRVKYCGVLAVCLVWGLISVALGISDMSLLGDQQLGYLSAERNTDFLFGSAMVLSAFLFVGFHDYVKGRYPVNRTFSIALLAGAAARFAAGLLPIEEDSFGFVHSLGSVLLVSSLPIVVLTFYVAQPPGSWRRLCGLLVGIEVVASVLGLFLAVSDYAILAQVVPLTGFHLWVFAVTFKPRRDVLPVPDARHLPLSVPAEPLPEGLAPSGREGQPSTLRGDTTDDDDHGPLAEARRTYLRSNATA